jgi:hypothetical protein
MIKFTPEIFGDFLINLNLLTIFLKKKRLTLRDLGNWDIDDPRTPEEIVSGCELLTEASEWVEMGHDEFLQFRNMILVCLDLQNELSRSKGFY